ncbi:MAG: 4-(cytidine 5'-diphospho)-2-C-methyl-D-erythritol kinase [Alphaproteobacteria bacterium]
MNGGPQASYSLSAPAKINLYLHVTGRRPDGYHLLDSLVVFADIADRLVFRLADKLDLDMRGPFAGDCGPVEDNLVLRAARALRQAAGISACATIELTKNIPPAAGLGGGSADAAAALKGLARLWNIAEGDVDLTALGLEIGADVPVCLAGVPSFVGGIGDELAAAPDLPAAGLLLVNPGVSLATPSVFAARRGGFTPAGQFTDAVGSAAELAALLAERNNDLTEAATRLAPAIGDVTGALRSLPGCRLARMTGSGATCFGLFDSRDIAAAAAAGIEREGLWVYPTGIAGAG